MMAELQLDTSQVMVDFNQMKSFADNPLVLERGKGIRVWDVFGKQYIDGLSGVFTVNYGHGVDEIIDVAADQARKIAFTAPTMSTNPPALKLANLLTSLLPEQFTTVKSVLSRQHWFRRRGLGPAGLEVEIRAVSGRIHPRFAEVGRRHRGSDHRGESGLSSRGDLRTGG